MWPRTRYIWGRGVEREGEKEGAISGAPKERGLLHKDPSLGRCRDLGAQHTHLVTLAPSRPHLPHEGFVRGPGE